MISDIQLIVDQLIVLAPNNAISILDKFLMNCPFSKRWFIKGIGPLGPIALGTRPLEEQRRNQGGTLNCKGGGRNECRVWLDKRT